MKDLDHFQGQVGTIMHRISKKLSDTVIQGLDNIYYFSDCNEKTPIGCIDRIFDEIQDVIFDAKKDDQYLKSAFDKEISLATAKPGQFMNEEDFNKYNVNNESQVFIKEITHNMTGSTITDDLKK